MSSDLFQPVYGALPDDLDGFGILADPAEVARPEVDRPEVKIAPKNPGYWQYTRTTFPSPKPLKDLRAEIVKGFKDLSVDFGFSEQHICGYAGSVVSLNALVEFEVSIFAEDSGHMVEVRHMYGCHFAFGHFAENFAKELKVVYQGGGRAIPFAPPPLPADFPVIEIPDSAVAQNCKFLHGRIEKGAPRESVLQGLRSIGSMACDPTHASQFKASGHAVVLTTQMLEIFNKSGTDNEVRVTAMVALANIANVKGLPNPFKQGLVESLKPSIEAENAHIKQWSAKAALGIANNDSEMKKYLDEEEILGEVSKIAEEINHSPTEDTKTKIRAAFDEYLSIHS